jgi:PmbA protein
MSVFHEQLPEKILRWAKQAGADDAEALLSEGREFSTKVHQGAIDTLKESTAAGVQIRVFAAQRTARAATSDLRDETLEGLVRRAVERAKLSSPDPFAGLPDKTGSLPDPDALQLYDPALETWKAEEKISLARKTEEISLKLDPQVNNSGGASFHTNLGETWLANTRGFSAGYRKSSCSLSIYLLGQHGNGAEQVSDFWYTLSRHRAKLETPEQVAARAVERVKRHFGARKVATQEVPVVFEPLVAAELLENMLGAVMGESIYLRRSFLVDQLGEQVAHKGITLVDDGLLPGGIGTSPFDLEGVASQRTPVIEHGVLHNYLCGTYSARKLKRKSTGNGTGGGESASNFYMEAGTHSLEAILATVKQGLYVTRLLGFGVNLVTGDFSRGAYGLWIEDGKLTYPVHEITISGNLRTMLEDMEMVGNDLELRDNVSAPTIKISRMTVSGT